MNLDFVKDVSTNILGYYFLSGVTIKPKSINELLHLIHHSALNNEFNYEILDLIKIESSLGEDIKIFGEINSFIQKTLPGLKTIGGEMHIMGLSGKTVIMVRDSGHASTLEIIKKNEMYEVSYFIPKVCNMDMIKQLKGINYYSSDYARGKFLIEKNLNNELTDFILSIPTDKDMILNNDYYR